MPFIWNDKTYWKRYKESAKIEFKILLPLVVVNFLVWYYFLQKNTHFGYIALLSFFSALSIFTFINIFKQYPNSEIPDTYSKYSKTFMYLFQFLISISIFIFFLVKILL